MLLNLGKLHFAIPYPFPSSSFLLMDLAIDYGGTVLKIERKALNWPFHRIMRLLRFFCIFL